MAAVQTDDEWLAEKVFADEITPVGDVPVDPSVRQFVTSYSPKDLAEMSSTEKIDTVRATQKERHGSNLLTITAPMLDIHATGTHNRAVRPTGELFTVSTGNRRATSGLFYTKKHGLFFGVIKYVGCPAWKSFTEGATRHFKVAPMNHPTVVLFVLEWRKNQHKSLEPFIMPEQNVRNVRLVLVNTTPAM